VNELTAKFYHDIRRIRRAEETVAKIYPSDKIKSPVHLAIGHEAINVGVCHNLKKEDAVFGYYRSHSLYLAKGGSLNAMMAELFGKIDGCARGWGGSMHLVDTDHNVMSTTAIVASSVPNAVGYAYALKLQNKDQIVVSFFGDGATEEGVFSESLNFAALHKLPILFVCENNELAIHTKRTQRQAVLDIGSRAQANGVPATVIENYNIDDIYTVSGQLINQIRAGQGPQFLEIATSRWLEHVGPNEDFKLGYRSEDEVRPWKENDEVQRLGSLLEPGLKQAIDQGIEEEIAQAVEFAESSAFPQQEELLKYVYK
jgi:TPP-dependent pyruvate/acetoin dehydrogenase alpha subunit